jgi:cytosine/adenosine deaminase-related metal-dependent hydrolase
MPNLPFISFIQPASPFLLTNLTLLTADGIIGHSLRVEGRRIAAINALPRPGDQVIDGQGGLLIPGLINAHDHLELNTFPRLKYRERYTHALQWIEDIEARFDSDPALTEPRRKPLADRLLVGALKNLLGGVTTVCHHNPLHRPLRSNYPLRVIRDYGFCHSLFRGEDVVTSYRHTRPVAPWIIHLAEGVDEAAAAEFDRLETIGLVQGNTVLVHGVGLTPQQRQTLMERGGGLIWCPGSNLFMLGQTAQVTELAAARKVALGSDSRLSGEFDLLAELQVADSTGQLSPATLFRLVTTEAAAVLRLPENGPGQLVVGSLADMVLLPPPIPADPFGRLLNLTRADLLLVMLAGRPVVAAPVMRSVFEATRTGLASVEVDGVDKLLAQSLVKRLKKSAVGEPGLTILAG